MMPRRRTTSLRSYSRPPLICRGIDFWLPAGGRKLINWFRRLFSAKVPIVGGRDRASPDLAKLKVIWRTDSFPMEVAGESHYQAALAGICGGHNRHGQELLCRAALTPEPANPHDSNAHKVMIEGRLVGYVPREHAARFAAAAAAVGRAGAVIAVDAVVRGGWRTNQHDEGHFGVRLNAPARGTILFEGHAPATKPAAARQAGVVRQPTAAVEASDDELLALDALIRRLQSTPVLGSDEAERRRRVFYSRVSSRMISEAVSSGVASGAPDHLTKGEAHFRAEMARMDNLLGEQIRIFQQGLDQWFEHGEKFAPYYPFRIAVILRKAKRGDLERAFLAAYVEHFAELRTGGSRYAQILDRAEKMGIGIRRRDGSQST